MLKQHNIIHPNVDYSTAESVCNCIQQTKCTVPDPLLKKGGLSYVGCVVATKEGLHFPKLHPSMWL